MNSKNNTATLTSLSVENQENIRLTCKAINAQQLTAQPLTVRAILKKLADNDAFELGFLAGNQRIIDPMDIKKVVEVIEILSSECAVASSAYMVNCVFAASIIALLGSDEQRATFLPKIKSTEIQFSFSLTEPLAGSDASGITTSVIATEHGYLLNGEKTYATGASDADYLLVVARIQGAQNRELSVFVVPTNTVGVKIERLRSLPGHVHPSCHIVLENVELSKDAVLGGEGLAWNVLKMTGLLERLVVAVSSVGLASSIVKRATEYAKQRHQFGQVISSFQSIQHMLVDMAITERTMRLMSQDAVNTLVEGKDASEQILMAKCYCSEQLQVLLAQGMRIMGGRAFFDFEEMSRYYLEAPLSLYAGGTIEVHKKLIARFLGI